ncbi:MAG: CusA/CzcA family heavy metal efflux RND transporter [Bacteroidota bacterium]|nr:CusA/CzcA family heavy metal efflux RND transporter [Bacteroidota bacterium]
MLNAIINYSIKNRMVVLLGTFLLIGAGVFSLLHIPIDAVPDITNNQVQIITTSPSLAPQEVERFITYPIEQTMTTIPQIAEMRSISRFGLSVVTLVFEDDVDIFWARQQINERLVQAKESIPQGVGTPYLAPVTTGLGEIFQYTLKVDPAYKQTYSLSQLRSIQDWIIRKQLLGTKGVADVSSFGGFVKQYEIAINIDRLNAMQVSMQELMDAIEKNNQNGGGAYIVQDNSAFYIRTEGLAKNFQDIENAVVKQTSSHIPILIKDVAVVKEGHAIRFGAMTYNNEGETVGGIVMMLKGANSNEVISNVKEKIKQIEKTLNPGVHIDPYLDRTQLVNRAINTVEKNLIEGALIVLFILILFLGNWRAGLLVASVIPLAMFFALTMMQLFGVSGNLMSLGAIDFGLIVDGAVIIVEAIMHYMFSQQKNNQQVPLVYTEEAMQKAVSISASRMMNAATFGQIIILIVYLPIFSLSGIEGKMFKPMAETVAFAIVGALLLSITYVPMMSAWVLSKTVSNKEQLGDKMMKHIESNYVNLLSKTLHHKKLVLLGAAIALISSGIIFTQMGGEFLPTLEEGDFAVETRLPTGSSLDETIKTAQQAAGLLKAQFPEVKKVIAKIGSSEIPTDPMPVESCDLIIVLNDKSTWTHGTTWQALANEMQQCLEVLPQASFGFQQPIQMRFNELIAGARQDVAIKIFGEDLATLTDLSKQIGNIIHKVNGAEDIYIEPMTGLPQLVVAINRNAIAQYGLQIEAVNKTVATAFAGSIAGSVYEGDQRYDICVRLDTQNRNQLHQLNNLYILNNQGQSIPLKEVASIQIENGPNQIQREQAQRRIIVGFNVRNRDVESIVKELQDKVNAAIKLPSGYRIDYGGQFENLIAAKKRLQIAVPISLLLIFILLFAAFRSAAQAGLIFTAIPFAAIGGIIALLSRGMPFSISAGIGFIALFGVAVLNGIVLIAEFNRLKNNLELTLMERIIQGSKSRIRPVLMTASVASLGFLPMALSHTAGAEVQKPLATVVIGGLLTSTLLTLFLLPVIYYLMEKKLAKKTMLLICFVGLLHPSSSSAQEHAIWKQCLQIGLHNNLQLQANQYEILQATSSAHAAIDFGKTTVQYMKGQYNSESKQDNNITITQTLAFPTTSIANYRALQQQTNVAAANFKLSSYELHYKINLAFVKLLYLHSQIKLLYEQDSLYKKLSVISEKRFKVGEATQLEWLLAQSKTKMNQSKIELQKSNFEQSIVELKTLMNATLDLSLGNQDTLHALALSTQEVLANHPLKELSSAKYQLSIAQKKAEQNRLAPDVSIGYFNQTLIGSAISEPLARIAGQNDRFQGMQVGIQIPLFFNAQQSKIKAAKWNMLSQEKNKEQTILEINSAVTNAQAEYQKQLQQIRFYQQEALPQASMLLSQGNASYKAGEINYIAYLQILDAALTIRNEYLQNLYKYDEAVIQLGYWNGTNYQP